jgi:CBS domain-containing protein
MKTVKDVMSTLAVWVSETASFREIAARLRECRVSAFPVLDAHGKVTGVVSEADLLVKEAVPDEPNVVWGLLAGIVHHAARTKAGGVTAADLMTSPAVTIGPDETVEHAARLMHDRKVKRLPVVDQAGRLVGIISRSDVLAIFDRTDAEIREEIMSQVTGRSEPSWYSVIVKGRRGDAGGHARDRRHRPRPGPAGPPRPGRGGGARPPCLSGSPRPQRARPLYSGPLASAATPRHARRSGSAQGSGPDGAAPDRSR